MANAILDLLYQRGDNTDIILPSGLRATVKEMSGLEQKIMSNRPLMMSGVGINQVLAACTVTLEDIDMASMKAVEAQKVMAGLLSADRQCLLFQTRLASLGDTFQFKTKCPECGVQTDWEVSLDAANFPATPFIFQIEPDGTVNKRFYTWDSVLRPGLRFKANFITGEDELKIARNKSKLNGLSDLEMRDLRVWDEEKGQWLVTVVAKLGDKLISEIREVLKKVEGLQEDKVSVTCADCGQEAEFHLLNLPDFMIHNSL